MVRKGMGSGQGKGYKNMIGVDSKVHSMSSKGIKQPQRINPFMTNEVLRRGKVSVDDILSEIVPIKDFMEFYIDDENETATGSLKKDISFKNFNNYFPDISKKDLTKTFNLLSDNPRETYYALQEIKKNEEMLNEKPFKDYYRDLREDAKKLDRSDLQGVVMVKAKEIMTKFKIPNDKYDEVENLLLLYADGEEDINSVQRYLLDLIPITEARAVYK